MVRIGAPHDGGYVVPSALLPRTRVLLSLGVSTDWSFESGFRAAAPQVRIVAVDGSVGGSYFLRAAIRSWFKVLFHLIALDTKKVVRHAGRLRTARDFFRFFRGENRFLRLWVAAEPGPGRTTLTRLIEEHGGGSELGVFLKVDIEGAEYEVLDQVIPLADRVLALAVEFHRIGERIEAFRGLVEQLSGEFALVHLHGNNFVPYLPEHDFPGAVEMTFVNRRILAELPGGAPRTLPIYGLDAPNDPSRPDHPLRVGAAGSPRTAPAAE